VQVVFPSGSCQHHQDAFFKGIGTLETAGFSVRYNAQRVQESWRDYLSGTDTTRFHELTSALSDPDVDIVWFGRGGSGCNRITPKVIEYAKTIDSKIVVGFSDATSLLNGLAQHLRWTTYHGPVVTTLGRDDSQTDVSQILQLLRGQKQTIALHPALHDASFAGRLYGGNLTVIASMLGTPYAPVSQPDAIWLLEDVGEAPYRLDRSFRQLVDSGLFDQASAIWLGDFDQTHQGQEYIERLFRKDAPCPVLNHAPAGHQGPLACLPIGAHVTISGRTMSAEWVRA